MLGLPGAGTAGNERVDAADAIGNVAQHGREEVREVDGLCRAVPQWPATLFERAGPIAGRTTLHLSCGDKQVGDLGSDFIEARVDGHALGELIRHIYIMADCHTYVYMLPARLLELVAPPGDPLRTEVDKAIDDCCACWQFFAVHEPEHTDVVRRLIEELGAVARVLGIERRSQP